MSRKGNCDIFPVCEKVLNGVGNQIVAAPCDGCAHWHEEVRPKPSFESVLDAIEIVQDWLREEDGKAVLIEKGEFKILEKSEYKK